jgi:hypothetical protein
LHLSFLLLFHRLYFRRRDCRLLLTYEFSHRALQHLHPPSLLLQRHRSLINLCLPLIDYHLVLFHDLV